MAVNDAKAILDGLSPKIGWGGAQLNKTDAVLKELLDRIYTDFPSWAIDKTISVRKGTATLNAGTVSVTFSGLGYGDMADANYVVSPVLSGVAQGSIAGKGLSINNKATTGFDVVCEDSSAADAVDLLIVGVAA